MRAIILGSFAALGAIAFTVACAGDPDGTSGDGDGDSGDGDVAGDGDGDGDGDSSGDGDGDGDSLGDGDGDGDSSGDGDGDGAGQTEIPTIPTIASSGCGTVDPSTGTHAIPVGEVSRTYIVELP